MCNITKYSPKHKCFYGLAHSYYILPNKLINNVTTKRYLTTQNIEIYNATMLLASHCYWRLADASCLIIHNSYKLPLTKNCRCSLYYNIELLLLGLLETFRPTVLTHMVQLRDICKMQTTWSLFRPTRITFGIKITVSGELRQIDVERILTPLNSKARNSLRNRHSQRISSADQYRG